MKQLFASVVGDLVQPTFDPTTDLDHIYRPLVAVARHDDELLGAALT